MSCKQSVVNAITFVGKSMRACPTQLIVSFLLIIVTFFMNLTAMVSNNWLSGSTPDTRQGLINYCIQGDETECCALLDDFMVTQNWTVPAFVEVTRTFGSIGLIMVFVTLVICVVTIMVAGDRPSDRPYMKKEIWVNMGFNAMSFLVIVIGVIVYGTRYRSDAWMNPMTLSWSYGFCAMAACLCVVNFAE